MTILAFLRDNARWLSAGMLLTFLSSFGQTFFISIFAGEIREVFQISHGQWGGIYAIGTTASAIVMALQSIVSRNADPLKAAVVSVCAFHTDTEVYNVIADQVILNGTTRTFDPMLRDMIEADHLPDYEMHEIDGDRMRFTRRDLVLDARDMPQVSTDALDAVRALWPGVDVYAIVAQWQTYWARSGRAQLRAPDAAFVGFAKTLHQRSMQDD